MPTATLVTRLTTQPGGQAAKGLPLSTAEIDANFINLGEALKISAPLASPGLTGTPTAPTPSAGTNSQQIATTAFVVASYLTIANPTATGTLTVPLINSTDATNSTSTTTGSVKIAGGASIVKDFYLGGNMYAIGDITSAYSSDERLKTNITEIKDALQKIKQLTGYTFTWNELSGKPQNVTEAGVLAGQVEAALPPAVVTRENGFKAVKYEQLSALIINAIKELSDKVDVLESKINVI